MTGLYESVAGFLRACWDEDEATARRSGMAQIAWLTYLRPDGGMGYTTVGARNGDHEPWCASGKALPEPDSTLLVYDPHQVLRQIARNRKILEEHRPPRGFTDRCRVCTAVANNIPTRFRAPCPTVRLLAAEYDDRPGYQHALWAAEN